MSIIRNALWLVAGTASSVLLSITAIPAVGNVANLGAPDTAALTNSEVMSEYHESLQDFDGAFPSGIEPASSLTSARGIDAADDEGRFEIGYSESMVVAQWRCAWEREWLAAASVQDASRMTTSRLNLNEYQNLEYTRKWVHDPENLWFRTVVESAYDGDVAAMNADVANNC